LRDISRPACVFTASIGDPDRHVHVQRGGVAVRAPRQGD
jgi:hypothetical protein